MTERSTVHAAPATRSVRRRMRTILGAVTGAAMLEGGLVHPYERPTCTMNAVPAYGIPGLRDE